MADQLLLDRVRDLAEQCLARGIVTHSAFLTPAEQVQAAAWLRKNNRDCAWNGGYDGAERQVCFMLPEGYGKPGRSRQDPGETWENRNETGLQPARLKAQDLESALHGLQLTWTARDASPGHRDCLGSLLALGIRRDQIGDILVMERSATVLVLTSIAPLIQSQLERVGRTPVTVAERQYSAIQATESATEMLKISVASLRLDKIAACGFNLSRTETADLIRNGMAQVNWQTELRPDRIVATDAVISLRGHGRIRLAGEEGRSRKNRHILLTERFAPFKIERG